MGLWGLGAPAFGLCSSALTCLSAHLSSFFCVFPLPWGSVLFLTCSTEFVCHLLILGEARGDLDFWFQMSPPAPLPRF